MSDDCCDKKCSQGKCQWNKSNCAELKEPCGKGKTCCQNRYCKMKMGRGSCFPDKEGCIGDEKSGESSTSTNKCIKNDPVNPNVSR